MQRVYEKRSTNTDVSGKGDVDNVFLDIVELTDGVDAESIHNSMMVSLHEAGMDDEFLKRHLISIATDGAAVLTGKNSGLIARLKNAFPNVQSVHCLAHRLELAVKDALKDVTGCNHFEFFISKLYSPHWGPPRLPLGISHTAYTVYIYTHTYTHAYTYTYIHT